MLSVIVRIGTLGTAPPATPAATAAAVKLPEVADQLLEKRQLAAWRRGCPGNRRDLLAVFQRLMVDRLNHPLVVEVDNIDLLVEYIRLKKCGLRGSPADVIPGLVVVKDADARRRAENLHNLVLGRGAGMNLGKFIRIGQIAALVHSWRAARKCSARNGGEENKHSPYRDGLGSEHEITQPAFC